MSVNVTLLTVRFLGPNLNSHCRTILAHNEKVYHYYITATYKNVLLDQKLR